MTVEIQIDAAALAETAERNLQAALHRTCYPPLDDYFVDHVDVIPGRSVWTAGPLLRTPVKVFVVGRGEAVAAANGVPSGAQRGAELMLAFRLSCTAGAVRLECVDVEGVASIQAIVGAAGPGLAEAIVHAIGAPARVELSTLLAGIGLGDVHASDAVLDGDTVCLRADPVGRPVVRVLPGHEWALSLDRTALARFGASLVPGRIRGLTSHQASAEWRWELLGGFLRVRVTGKVDIPDPATATVDATLDCGLSLRPGVPGHLLADVRWAVKVDLGVGGAALTTLEDLLTAPLPGVSGPIRTLVRQQVAHAFDPVVFGGVKTGERTFTIERALPVFDLARARMHADGMDAGPDGIVLGGSVATPVDIGRRTVAVHPRSWAGGAQAVTWCSQGATSDETPHPHLFTSAAEIEYVDGGALCDVQILSHPELTPYLHVPAAARMWEPLPGDGTVRMILPVVVANDVRGSVTVLMRTARGVRVVDLGRPTGASIAADGTVEFGSVIYIDDCLAAPPPDNPDDPFYDGMTAAEILEVWERWSGVWEYWSGCPGWVGDLLLAAGIDIEVLTQTDHLLLDRTWQEYVGGREFLDIQLAQVRGLEPGELVEFRSPDHRVQVAAGADSTAWVPCLLPVEARHRVGRAELYRLNRRSLAGKVRSRAVVFEAIVAARGAESFVDVDPGGEAFLNWTVDGENMARSFGRDGMLRDVPEAAASSRRRLVPTAPDHDLGLVGTRRVVTLPGFDDAPIRLVAMDDSAIRVVDVASGVARVTGTFRGPIGEVAIDSDWAVVQGTAGIQVFRVHAP